MDDDVLELLPSDVLSGRAMPQEMIVALRAIAQLSPEVVESVTEYLSSLRGVTAEKEVYDGIGRLLQDPEDKAATSILETLLNVTSASVPKHINLLDRWRQSSEERRQFFSDELFANLNRNLPELAKERPSIALIRKANYLLRSVGNELDDVAYFCDLRPVFDKSRKGIDGFVLLANLRIMYRSQDNIQHTFEVALTEDEVRQVSKASSDALAKLEVLRTTSARLNQNIQR